MLEAVHIVVEVVEARSQRVVHSVRELHIHQMERWQEAHLALELHIQVQAHFLVGHHIHHEGDHNQPEGRLVLELHIQRVVHLQEVLHRLEVRWQAVADLRKALPTFSETIS